ncbi:MAG: lipid A biosynthesis lauroyl acyltransferase [Rhodospirillales bacterium]
MSDRMVRRTFFKAAFVDPAQAFLVRLAILLFRALPLDNASAFGGWLVRKVGPMLKQHRIALNNLRKAFPEKTDDEIARIADAMWDNLGRTAGEYPHLDRFDVYNDKERFETRGGHNIRALRDDGICGIFFSGHIGNWEIVSLAATQQGVPLTRIFRAPNNRSMNWLFENGRQAVAGDLVPKGSEGAKAAMKALRDGGHLGMLVDQKMNDGIEARLFGRPAMTAPALALFALKFRCPVVPARVTRLDGAHFRIDIEDPLVPPEPSGDRHTDILAFTQAVNDRLEAWIRETPEQWLWVHRRWPD